MQLKDGNALAAAALTLLWRESDGRFDITSGVLRRAWRFDGSDHIPDRATVAALLPLVGWDKVIWESATLCLAHGMEIDFGGIGKEHAVDVTLRELMSATDKPVLVNFGGDIAASGPRRDGAWRVGIDSGVIDRPAPLIRFEQGAIATSGTRDGICSRMACAIRMCSIRARAGR